MGIVSVSVFADYIPYKSLPNYTFSQESGWRAGALEETFYVSTTLKNTNELEIPITKRLYDELMKHGDYKDNLSVTEWAGENLRLSYSYNVILPKTLLNGLTKTFDFTFRIEHPENKICKGIANIDKSGFIWCTADRLDDIVKSKDFK